MVGDYVPFYFCPRSVMLYVISRGNSELEYRDGQRGIIHLVSDVNRAAATGKRVAFSDCNASASYAGFSADLGRLGDFIEWNAVKATQWADPAVKDKKQAEFLVHDFVPWTAFHQIGVYDTTVLEQIRRIVERSTHRPDVTVRGGWYY